MNTHPIDLANQYFEEGEALFKQSEFNEHYELFEKASLIYLEYQQWEKYIMCRVKMSKWYFNKEQLVKSEKIIKENISIYKKRKINNESLKGNMHYYLSTIYFEQRNFQRTMEEVQKAKDIFQSIGDNMGISKVLMMIGSIFLHDYKPLKGLSYYFQALSFEPKTEEEKSKYDLESKYFNIAYAYYALNQNQLAYVYFQRAFHITYEKHNTNHPLILRIISMLGEICIRQKRYSEAENVLRKGLLIFDNSTLDSFGRISLLFYLGKLYAIKKKWKEAHIYFEKAMRIQEESSANTNDWIFNYFLIIGELYKNQEDWKKAIQYHQKALEANSKGTSAKNYYDSEVYLSLAVAYYHINELDKSLENSTNALTSWNKAFKLKNTADKNMLYSILYCQFNTYRKKFKKTASEKCLESTLELIPIIHQTVENLRVSTFTESDYLILNKCSVEFYIESLDVLFDDFLMKGHKTILEEIFGTAEKNKVHSLLSKLKAVDALKLTDIVPEKLIELQKLQTEISKLEKKVNLILKTEKELLENKTLQRLIELQIAYHQFIKELEKDHPEYLQFKRQLPHVDVKGLQHLLNSQTAIIEYGISYEYLYTFCLTKTNLEVKRQLMPTDFEDLLAVFIGDGLLGMNRKKYVKTAHQLYQILIEPITFLLQKCEIKNLLIIPSTQLLELPFESLLTYSVNHRVAYKDLPYLLQSYTIQYHYSATLWAYQQNRSKKQTIHKEEFIGFAPVYAYGQKEGLSSLTSTEAVRDVNIGGSNYQALLYSEKEVRDIEANFAEEGKPTQVHLRAEANLRQFKETLSRSSAKYLHIAAHSVLNEEEEDLVGILFSPSLPTHQEYLEAPNSFAKRTIHHLNDMDMILYPNEVRQLQLQSDLVFLSCCKSGIGRVVEGEGMLSINRSFLYAGVSNIVFTLFKIYDTKTPILTHYFYKALLQEGKNYTEALQYAKQQMIEADILPKFWSGFLLLGV